MRKIFAPTLRVSRGISKFSSLSRIFWEIRAMVCFVSVIVLFLHSLHRKVRLAAVMQQKEVVKRDLKLKEPQRS
jgi:hypothetical protein